MALLRCDMLRLIARVLSRGIRERANPTAIYLYIPSSCFITLSNADCLFAFLCCHCHFDMITYILEYGCVNWIWKKKSFASHFWWVPQIFICLHRTELNTISYHMIIHVTIYVLMTHTNIIYSWWRRLSCRKLSCKQKLHYALVERRKLLATPHIPGINYLHLWRFCIAFVCSANSFSSNCFSIFFVFVSHVSLLPEISMKLECVWHRSLWC